MKRGTLKFTYNAGILVANQVKSEIESVCFRHNLNCDIKNFGGMLVKSHGVTITGPEATLKQLAPQLQKWLQSFD